MLHKHKYTVVGKTYALRTQNRRSLGSRSYAARSMKQAKVFTRPALYDGVFWNKTALPVSCLVPAHYHT